MKNAWNSYKEELFKRLPALRDTLNEGASKAEIKAVEDKMGINFPEELRTLYIKNNGDNGSAVCGMILGFDFYDLDELYSEWKGWKDIEEMRDADDNCDPKRYTSEPEKCIKPHYVNSRWIPICGDGGGNHIGIDLDPDVNGKVGQVINFGRDEDKKTVLADSLTSFFERLTRIVKSDDLYIGEFDGENVVFLRLNGEDEVFQTDYLRHKDSVK
ncbi:MAG: SMI1/KNR4 family protein [Ruminococcus sp.]|nr:SMI1/KNR4 family protein [Ruminococcus sp.]